MKKNKFFAILGSIFGVFTLGLCLCSSLFIKGNEVQSVSASYEPIGDLEFNNLHSYISFLSTSGDTSVFSADLEYDFYLGEQTDGTYSLGINGIVLTNVMLGLRSTTGVLNCFVIPRILLDHSDEIRIFNFIDWSMCNIEYKFNVSYSYSDGVFDYLNIDFYVRDVRASATYYKYITFYGNNIHLDKTTFVQIGQNRIDYTFELDHYFDKLFSFNTLFNSVYYDEGYNLGFTLGEDYGYGNGEEYGYAWGYEEGYAAGSSEGAEDNYTSGYNAGYGNGVSAVTHNPNGYDLYTSDQYTNNYNNGYSAGYEAGFDADGTVFTIFNGILNVALVPINFFLSIFNFEILGINLKSLVSALLTVSIIIIVIRLITGKKE